jgi:hypothetical protein
MREEKNMNKITMEKVLHFAGSLIGAIFLIAWNVAKIAVPVFLGMAAAHAEAVDAAEEEHSDDYTPFSMRDKDGVWYDSDGVPMR